MGLAAAKAVHVYSEARSPNYSSSDSLHESFPKTYSEISFASRVTSGRQNSQQEALRA